MKVFLVLTSRRPAFDPGVLDQHFAFLDELRKQGRLGLSGGFADKTGGAYIVMASSPEEATAIALEDPLNTSGSSAITVREWLAR
ncbi:MAG: YciI family protein [Bacillota bacterium]